MPAQNSYAAVTPAAGDFFVIVDVSDDTQNAAGSTKRVLVSALATFVLGDASASDLTKLSELTATSTELNYVDGVTSAIQTQLDAKAATASLGTVATSNSYTDLDDLPTLVTSLAGLSDVDDTVASPSDGNILVYRDAGSDWVLEAKPAGGSNPAINDVTDITITTPADNEVLAYDNGSGEWINQTAAEAGLQAVLSEGAFVNGDKTKLDGIEASADVTDAANVETAIEGISLTAVTGATGDEVLIVDATDGGLKAVLWENLPSGSGDAWGDAVDADIVPDADGTRDLGSTANRFASLHVDSIDLNGSTLDGTTLADPDADRIVFWDDSEGTTAWLTAGSGLTISTATMTVDTSVVATLTDTQALTNKTIDGDSNTLSNLDIGNEVDWAAAADVTDASAFESGDKVLIFEAGVGLRKVDYTDLPGAGGGLSNIVEDTTPQLGGDLDLNGNVITGMVIGTDIQAFDADTLKADTTDELAVGYTQVVNAIGTVSSGTTTLAFADSNVQTLTNGGAFTLAPPSSGNGVITLEITNNASAGAITTSGFSSVTGDSFTTTDGDIFLCSVAKIGSTSYLNVVAHAGNA